MDLPPPPPQAPSAEVVEAVHPLAGDLADYVRDRCNVVRVHVAELDVRVPQGASTRVWQGDPCRPFPALRLQFRVDGQLRSAPARPHLQLWVEGPVAPSDVVAGEPFEVDRGAIPWRDAQGNHLVGTVVSRVDLSAGQPVTPRQARRLPDASSGDRVDLVLERGSVRLTAPGELLSTGFVGDRVSVRNRTTLAVQRGVLVGPQTVELSP